MKEQRGALRLNYRARINITFASGETMEAHTHDMSNVGLLIDCAAHPKLTIGELAEVIVLDINDAIAQTVEIIRIDSKGYIAVKFISS